MIRRPIAMAIASQRAPERNLPSSREVPTLAVNFLWQWFVMRHSPTNAEPAAER
jgi:hypothetical protein